VIIRETQTGEINFDVRKNTPPLTFRRCEQLQSSPHETFIFVWSLHRGRKLPGPIYSITFPGHPQLIKFSLAPLSRLDDIVGVGVRKIVCFSALTVLGGRVFSREGLNINYLRREISPSFNQFISLGKIRSGFADRIRPLITLTSCFRRGAGVQGPMGRHQHHARVESVGSHLNVQSNFCEYLQR
jgi:hypothetical protein